MEGRKPGLLTWKALLANPRPSCRQTTMASTMPQFSPHTVPHTRDPFLSASTSTRPSKGFRPPFRRSCREKGRHGHQEGWRGAASLTCHQSQFSHRVLPGTLNSIASPRAMLLYIRSRHRHPGALACVARRPLDHHSVPQQNLPLGRRCLSNQSSGQVLAWLPTAPLESTGGELILESDT